MNSDLVFAIANKRLIEFVYKAERPRIVEPQDYGIRGGVEKLLNQRRKPKRRAAWLEALRRCRNDSVARARSAIPRLTCRQQPASRRMGHAVRPREIRTHALSLEIANLAY